MIKITRWGCDGVANRMANEAVQALHRDTRLAESAVQLALETLEAARITESDLRSNANSRIAYAETFKKASKK